jgi:hypothetical protein
MKHLSDYIKEELIKEADDFLGLSGKDSGSEKKDDKGGDDFLGLGDEGEDKKKDDSSEEPKEDEPKDNENKDEEPEGEDPKDDKGSKPQIDPKLKERAEIKFKIWKDGGERADWIKDNDGYQKIEYVYKDRKKGIVIDFLLGRKDGEWSLWAGKNGGVSYDDEPLYNLDAKTFQSALMNSLDKIQDLIADVKANPANWPQYYINK